MPREPPGQGLTSLDLDSPPWSADVGISRAGVGTDTLILGKLQHHVQVELLCSWQDYAGIRWAYVRAQGQSGWVAEQEGPHRYLIQPES